MRLEQLEDRWNPATVTNLDATGAGSLKQVFLDANATAGQAAVAIDFQAGLNGVINLNETLSTTRPNISITGLGADTITLARPSVNGTPFFRIFDIASTADGTKIEKLKLSNGKVDVGEDGGGIRIQQTTAAPLVTLKNLVIANCNAGRNGGAVACFGRLVMESSKVENNNALGSGGGLYVRSYDTWVNDCELLTNTAQQNGGGIDMAAGVHNYALTGNLKVTGGKLFNNLAKQDGGGIHIHQGTNAVTVMIEGQCHVDENRSEREGGGVWSNAATTIKDSFVEKNSGWTTGFGIFNAATGTTKMVLLNASVRLNVYIPQPGGPAVGDTAAIWTDGTVRQGANLEVGQSTITGNNGHGILGNFTDNGGNTIQP